MNAIKFLKITAVVMIVVLTACRGQTMETPPIHPNLNMDQQNRVEAQERVEFFTDNRAMRQPVEGTVMRNGLRHDKALYQGINEDSSFVEENPIEVTKEFLFHGQDRFEVYCTPCHGIAGDGTGVIATGGYGLVPPPSYHIERLRNVNDGYLYSVITNGIRTMQSYAHQIPVKDRWAIVAYIRALQQSQHVPETEMQQYDVDLAAMKEDARKQLAAEEAARQAREEASAGAEITAAKGEQLAQDNTCFTCHSVDGTKKIGPTWQNLYGHEVELADGSTVMADEAYITESIVNSTAKTVAGFPAGGMTNFDYLSSSEIQNIIAYIKSLSNTTLDESEEGSESQQSAPADTAATGADTTATQQQPTAARDTAASAAQNTTAADRGGQTASDTTETLSASARNGKQLFQKYECLSCHTIDGSKELAPAFRGLFGSSRKLEDGSSVIADEGYIKESIQYPGANVALGFINNMPPYRDLLSDQDLQAITDYIKTLH